MNNERKNVLMSVTAKQITLLDVMAEKEAMPAELCALTRAMHEILGASPEFKAGYTDELASKQLNRLSAMSHSEICTAPHLEGLSKAIALVATW